MREPGLLNGKYFNRLQREGEQTFDNTEILPEFTHFIIVSPYIIISLDGPYITDLLNLSYTQNV